MGSLSQVPLLVPFAHNSEHYVSYLFDLDYQYLMVKSEYLAGNHHLLVKVQTGY